ncbi:tetratricopeptide repeat protein [Ktedonobacteria bacterium brp13]|nr:tetratricopeptide repeat protein [Ktedonobacteria bacterium brp13]
MQSFSTSFDTMVEQYTTLLQTLCDISESYYYLGRLDDAIKLLKIGEQLLEAKEVTRHDQLKLLLQSGKILISSIFYRNRDAEEAFATVTRAKQLAAFIVDEHGEADALDLLGFAYYYKQLMTKEGESSTPLAYCQQALERREVLGDQRGMSESSFHIGLIYENGDQSDLDQARIYYTKAYQIAREHGYKLEQSYAVRHLGGLLDAMQGDLEQARQCFEESLVLRQEIGFKIALPFSHLAVGEICTKQNELTVAATHYQQAEVLARELEQPVACILSQLSLGELYLAQQQCSQALECIEQAYRVAKEYHLTNWMSEATARREAISN